MPRSFWRRHFWRHHRRSSPALIVLLAASLTACGPGNPPEANDGPPFVITSPQPDALVAGPVFFAVQPMNPGDVDHVVFEAGDATLEVDSPGEDAFRVYLLPSDFDDGELELSATTIGQDGRQRRQSILVTIVRDPPGSATIGSDGAVLGTTEANGALSTLTVPPGSEVGATVTFAAKTKDEVKTSTGVDYDALGVTFLGAQEISATANISAPLAVSSGGFGPMVQPDQVVVNYIIAPDADGDGEGELVVVNGASIAPNGDVITDPVPRIQLADSGAAARRGLFGAQQAGTLSGPPGTLLQIDATGFNAFSALGTLATFESSVDGTEVELPVLVDEHFESPGATPTLNVYLPVLPAGAATLTLRNVATSEVTPQIAVTVQAPATIADPAAVIDELLAETIAALARDPGQEDAVSQLGEIRSAFQDMADAPTAEEAQALQDTAVLLSNSNLTELISRLDPGSSAITAQQCSAGAIASAVAEASLGLVFVAVSVNLLPFAALGGALPTFLVGGLYGLGAAMVHKGIFKVGSTVYECVIPPPPEFCLPPYKSTDLAPFMPPRNPVPGPGGLRAQQATPPAPITGMGSVLPPGGDSCGSAVGASPTPAGAGQRLTAQSSSLGELTGDLAGRFVVKVFFSGANPVPFTGISDASGYFYIPTVPAGQPFEAIAIDTLTGQTRSFEGTGPELGTSTYMFFDFLGEGEDGGGVIAYDSNTEGVHDGLDVYFFEGRAGDLINLAWFTEGGNLGSIAFTLSDPTGRLLIQGIASGGFLNETEIMELALDGLYSFTLDGTDASGNYTLGLALIEPPVAIDPTVPLVGDLAVLGDTQYFSFTGELDELLDVTLSHEAASLLNAELRVLRPAPGVPFHGPHGVQLSLRTEDDRRTTSSGPRALTVAGEYLLELSEESVFEDELARYFGTWSVELSLTPQAE